MANIGADFFSSLKRTLGRLVGFKSGGDAAPWTATTDSGSFASSASGPKSAQLAFGSEPRRYKRAILLVGNQKSLHLQLASALASYRGHSYSVVDLSHTGLAILRESIGDHELPDVTQSEPMNLSLGMLPAFSVQVKLVRHSEKILAFEFVSVPTDGRKAIDKFLDPKMVGLNMRAVDRAYFSPGETFSLWFCGPRDTNFFLWLSGSQLERAIIQLGEETFALFPLSVSGVRFVRQSDDANPVDSDRESLRKSVHFALDVALQIQQGGDAINGLVKLLTEASDTLPREG